MTTDDTSRRATPELPPSTALGFDAATRSTSDATTPSTPSTPGHTIGPFFHDALGWTADGIAHDLATPGSVLIEGRIVDGDGLPLPAWLVEAWMPQAVSSDKSAGVTAPGLRRLADNPSGMFALHAPIPAPGQPAAFITLFGAGLTRHFHTAVFLEDASAVDGSFLAAIAPERRHTLIAERLTNDHYRWAIRTQGDGETVFLDFE